MSKPAGEIADSIRRFALSLLELADTLDPPKPRKPRQTRRKGVQRRRKRVALPDLDAATRARLEVISSLHPTPRELDGREIAATTEGTS